MAAKTLDSLPLLTQAERAEYRRRLVAMTSREARRDGGSLTVTLPEVDQRRLRSAQYRCAGILGAIAALGILAGGIAAGFESNWIQLAGLFYYLFVVIPSWHIVNDLAKKAARERFAESY